MKSDTVTNVSILSVSDSHMNTNTIKIIFLGKNKEDQKFCSYEKNDQLEGYQNVSLKN